MKVVPYIPHSGNASEAETVIELCLCESERLILKANTFYRFTVDETCDRCKELDKLNRPG